MTAWLADTLIATSALMLLVLALREPVRRQFGAPAAYALWLLPAARMAMPPLTETVERIVPAAPPLDMPVMMVPIAPIAEPSLLERLGGWPKLLIAAWAIGALIFLALGLVRLPPPTPRGARRRGAIGADRLDPAGPKPRGARPDRLRNPRPRDRRPGRFRPPLRRGTAPAGARS